MGRSEFVVLTQNQIGKFVLCTNIILDKFYSEKQSIDYVVTLTRGFNSRWSGFLENQGFNGKYYSDAIFRTGAAFLVKQNVQIDASIGANYKDTPSILAGGVGLSWRFDKNYSEVLYRIPKEKDKKKSKADKKKDKKKAKDKKRLDEI